MPEAVTFSDLESIDSSNMDQPFFAIDLNNDDTVLTWLKQEFNKLKIENTDRFEEAKNNYLRYKGYQYMNNVYQPRDVLEAQKRYTPQIVLPMISDAVDEKTARLMETKPYVAVIPKHDETKDKQDAKMAKMFLSHVDYVQKFDEKLTKTVKNSKITGECFLWIRWNPDLGDDLIEKNVQDKMGEKTWLKTGDVEVLKKTLTSVLYPKMGEDDWSNVDYAFVIEYPYTEAIKRDYPQFADQIAQDNDCKLFNYETMQEIDLKNRSRKVTFYHKKTKYLPQGFEACYVNSKLLKSGPLSYEHGELPIERLVDIQNDEELSGQSFIGKVKSIAAQANNSLNAIIKMMMLAGYAKWFVETGSIDEEHLNNDVSIVKVKKGFQKPILAQANPVGESHFLFVEKLKEWFYEFSKSNSVVRGEPPPGVTAFVALQFVSESESRRLNTEVQQTNAFVRAVYDKILKTCAQKYKPDEKRTMLLMGKDNKWEMQDLDIAALKKPYSVVLQNAPGLSESKSLKTQQVIDLEERFPGIVPREQVVEMVGLAQGDKFLDVAARAARSAEDENERMSEAGGQVEPADWEDHITHWKIHVQEMQPIGFKEKAGPQIINDFVEHVRAHEMFMLDSANNNPLYAQALATLPGFPLFMESPLPPLVTPPEQMPAPMDPMLDPMMETENGPAVEGLPYDDSTDAVAQDAIIPEVEMTPVQ